MESSQGAAKMISARIGNSARGRETPDKSGASGMADRPQKMPITPMKTMRPFCASNCAVLS